MATNKNKSIKVNDLKPRKDAKGGRAVAGASMDRGVAAAGVDRTVAAAGVAGKTTSVDAGFGGK